MSVSQFTKFTSSDPGGPGPLFGTAGSLLALLDACLTGSLGSGYPIANAAALGWTKPFANSGNIGCYKQPAGAGKSLLINDNGANATSTFKEAWAIGWETIATIASPVGTGTGQFPTPAQLLTTGHTVIRKSATADTTNRTWILFADTSTFYLFVLTGDTSGVYYAFGFGDFFSLNNTSDSFRCMIMGRNAENSASGASESMDTTSNLNTGVVGSFIDRAFGGTGTSVTAGKHGDSAKANGSTTLLGGVVSPNGSDNAFYLSPVWITESANSNIRGQLRGFYHQLHPIASFTDGQTFTGSGAFAGKSFYILNKSVNSGCYCIETSNTVETN